ncbi:hypothetical protein SETIT_8G180300v2 [Setaria italica]|uniref:Uncharacterized protein n=1 Tax=Setaria italica TaxID=4555 RepID=A0A368SAQ2_SETIT|nr:hypothetical protein SETIT_8G180300v2 [Setaria italica]
MASTLDVRSYARGERFWTFAQVWSSAHRQHQSGSSNGVSNRLLRRHCRGSDGVPATRCHQSASTTSDGRADELRTSAGATMWTDVTFWGLLVPFFYRDKFVLPLAQIKFFICQYQYITAV